MGPSPSELPGEPPSPAALFARYLRQRQAMGEPNLLLDRADVAALSDLEGRSTGERSPSSVTEARTPRSDKPGAPRARDRSAGPKWQKGAPPIPAAGIVIPAPATDLFNHDPLVERNLQQLAELIGVCDKCALCRERTHAVPGEGPDDASLMVVGEGPGATEDETGRPFVGRAGELLTDILRAIDCPRETVFICNIVKCRPPGNRSPERQEITACLPYLYRQIALVAPSVILAMGSTAACTLLETRASLGSLRHKVHQFRGIPLVVTYHPAALLRNPHWKKPTWDDVRVARRLLAGDR